VKAKKDVDFIRINGKVLISCVWMRFFKDVDITVTQQNVPFPWMPLQQCLLGLQIKQMLISLENMKVKTFVSANRASRSNWRYNTKIFPLSLTQQGNRGLFSPNQTNTIIVAFREHKPNFDLWLSWDGFPVHGYFIRRK